MTTRSPQPDQPRWLSDDEQAAWRGWLRMTAELTLTLSRHMSALGLSLPEYGVLALLSEHELRRPFELGVDLGLEKSRLSHLLTRLEGRGLIERRECPTDQRGQLVALTAAGQTLLEATAPQHVDAVRDAFIDRLTPTQLRQLVAISTAVTAAGIEA